VALGAGKQITIPFRWGAALARFLWLILHLKNRNEVTLNGFPSE
jgi:hypothetical protein